MGRETAVASLKRESFVVSIKGEIAFNQFPLSGFHCITTSEKQKRPTARPWDPTAFYNLFEFELKVVFICYGPISTQL